MKVWFHFVAALVAGVVLSTSARAADPLPIASFVSRPDIADIKLSPSGKYMALTIANKSGRTILAVSDVDQTKPPTIVAASPKADIRSFQWVNDDWLVFNLVDLQAPAFYQDFGPGLFSVRRDGSQGRQLITTRGSPIVQMSLTGSTLLEGTHYLLETLRDGSNDVIVGNVRFDDLGEVISITPKRLDVSTGRATIAVLGYPERTSEWVFDSKGVARVAVADKGGWVETFWRDDEKSPWRSLQRVTELDPNAWRPLEVDGDGTLYVAAPNASGYDVITRFDFATGQPDTTPLASAPGFDLDQGLVFSGRSDKLVGVRVVTDAETTVWFDPALKKLQELADARFPGRIARVSCSACTSDESTVLVKSFSDHDPGTFSLYRPKAGTWTTIGQLMRDIDPKRMADLDLHRVKARDGLELPVWVTRPKIPKGPLPAVLLVHGGPWVRGVDWSWNGEAQLLASRGYVVIEPEFRGSQGYGSKLFRAGWKTWGTTMQDDLADAVRWAADQGIADPKRVCIVGASYGGYAALMAPIRYPDMFRCSVAWVAVSDPRLMFEESWQNDIGRSAHFSMRQMIGDPDEDAAMLRSFAPAERAAEFRIPLLMAYGSEDVRVPLEHGSKMRSALRAAGRDPEWVVYSGEGHGFLKPENRIDFYTRMEKFLARYLEP